MNNTYGTVKPSVIDPRKDVEIWYKYTPSRSNNEERYNTFKKISSVDVTTMLTKAEIGADTIAENELKERTLPGMYNLSLPAAIFGNKGFYTVYIKPKEIVCRILDVGALAAYPDTRGIVIDMNTINADDSVLFKDDNLTGYRVEYFGSTSEGGEDERMEYYRLITSSGLCEAVSQNLTNANTSSTGYRYNETASLAFLSLSPSTSPSFKGSSQKPFIGSPSQKITITNTKFDPVCIEIEICENDFDTLNTILTGDQIRSLDNGRLTTYNSDGEIFNQYEMFTIKDSSNNDRFDVRKNIEDNIDFSVDYVEIMNSEGN